MIKKLFITAALAMPAFAGYWTANTASNQGASAVSTIAATWSTVSPAAPPSAGQVIHCLAWESGTAGATFTMTDSALDIYTADGTQNTVPNGSGSSTIYVQTFHSVILTGTVSTVTFNTSINVGFPTVVCSASFGDATPGTVDAINISGTVSGGVTTVSLSPSSDNDLLFCPAFGRSGFTLSSGMGLVAGSVFGTYFLNQLASIPVAGTYSYTVNTTSTTGGMICVAINSSANATISVPLNGSDTGSVFQGIGVLSAGASSRLLFDYPATQQSEILNYYFGANGAASQILKVEIGSDANSTWGAEPSYDRTGAESVPSRGYEAELIVKAKAINPNIKIAALPWGTAGWVSTGGAIAGCSGSFFTTNNVNYMVGWVQAMESYTGFNVDYIGIWNETAACTAWTKALRVALNAASLSSTLILTDDNVTALTNWGIASTINGDATLKSDIAIVGQHYITNPVSLSQPSLWPTATATGLGKPLWDAEDGPYFYGNYSSWPQAERIMNVYQQNYIQGGIVSETICCMLASYYDSIAESGVGLIQANSPWSGNYTVWPGIWATAHWGQFTGIGWQYLNSASAYTYSAVNGTYDALKSTNNSDYSFIIQTAEGSLPQTFNFTISNGLSSGTVFVWKSDVNSQFVQQSSITPSGGTYSFVAQPGTLYTISTLGTGSKYTTTPPTPHAFPFPYVDTWQSYSIGASPKYLSDTQGSFEMAACVTGRTGNCLQQSVVTAPVPWSGAGGFPPTTIIGDATWTSYSIQSDVLLGQSGTISLFGRVTSQPQKSLATGYSLNVSDSGAWTLLATASTLASGTLGSFGINTWHTLKMTFSGTTVTALVDGSQIASVTSSTYSSGMVGLGTSGYISAQFDNLQICNINGQCFVSTGYIP